MHLPDSSDTAQFALEANAAGVAALREGDSSKAAELFRKAADFDPASGLLLLNLAHAYRLSGDAEGERSALDGVLRIDQADFPAWFRKAQLEQRLGEVGDSMRSWATVFALAEHAQDLAPDVVETLERARGYVDRLKAKMAKSVDAAIDSLLSSMDDEARHRAEAFVHHSTERRRIFLNQCSGLHYPFLPAMEFFPDRLFPWIESLAKQASDIREEFLGLSNSGGLPLKPYVQLAEGSHANVWTDLDQSLDWGACFLWERGVINREVYDRCPKTVEALNDIPLCSIDKRSPTVFFSVLRPQSHIPPHTGVTNTRAIVHLPLVVPSSCRFRVGGETRKWREGIPFVFDDTIEHEAWNNSDELRAVLIFDVWNPYLSASERELVSAYYAAADSSGLAPKVVEGV